MADEETPEDQLIAECRGQLEVARAEIDHLKTALVSARRIGAAMGIIMARLNVSEDDAFERLRDVSQHTNQKVRDLADQVVYTGVIPDPAG